MDAHRKTGRAELIQITPLPQIVPSRVCLSCDVCCRFPERDSFLRPYFTADEIRRAVAAGIDPAHFADPNGCQVSVVPNTGGEGYHCPAFDPATSHCRIYEVRPLDCQIYPLAVMWSAPLTPALSPEGRGEGEGREVVLGWDSKCPFLREDVPLAPALSGVAFAPKTAMSHGSLRRFDKLTVPSRVEGRGSVERGEGEGIEAYANKIAELIEREDSLETFAHNPALISRFQEDVVILRSLPRLSARLGVAREELGVRRETRTAPVLRPLTLAGRVRFEEALASIDTPLAPYAFAFHYIWRELFTYSWAEIEGQFCLFAQYADGIYMPLPPLPPGGEEVGTLSYPSPLAGEGWGEGDRSFSEALKQAFAFMRASNKGSAVTRVEHVSEEQKPFFETLGYRVTPKDPDYLYRARDLARLAGDRYKSQRAACNRFVREHRYRYSPYQEDDRDACLALFHDWARQKVQAGVDSTARQMLADAESAHREALTHHQALGAVGRVVRVAGHIRAYTVGYQRTPSVFCVLLEVTDRGIPGLAEFIFRECCREAVERGYEFVNTMDDSGLPHLARSKQAYHPVRLVPSYIASER